MTYLPPVLQVLIALLVIPAALFDVRERRIPNWLALAGVLSGLALNSQLNGVQGLWFALKGIGLAMLIYLPLWLIRGMGAGDVKLMAAVGAIVGPMNWIGVLLLTSIFGAIAALVLVFSKGRVVETLVNLREIVTSLATFRKPYEQARQLDVANPNALRLPHGVAIAFGSLAFLIATGVWAPRY